MKLKLLAMLSALAIALSLTACAASAPLPGEELILAAREAYTALGSARVDVVNNETGEAEQTFIFKCDEKGIMTYSYVGRSDGIYLEQYNNGREQFTNDNGVITALDASDLQFTAYSRDVPYPMAGEGLILFYKKGVIADESYIEEKDGITEVHHRYDVSKLGQYDGEGELAGFDVTYRFDSEGNLIDVTEATTVRNDVDESSSTVSFHVYTIYISEQNSISRVENIVDISELGN